MPLDKEEVMVYNGRVGKQRPLAGPTRVVRKAPLKGVLVELMPS